MFTPASPSFFARVTTSGRLWLSTDTSIPTGELSVGILISYPAARSPLNIVSAYVFPTPRTSPVDFISGPRIEFASVSLPNENTGTLTAKYGGAGWSPMPHPMSASFSPSMTRDAISTIGTPVTLLI